MKLAMNGALTIGTDDGANVEMGVSLAIPTGHFSLGFVHMKWRHLKHPDNTSHKKN